MPHLPELPISGRAIAVAMASAARTVAEISDGRFILGIGVSHKPLVANRGHTYDKPYSYMKQYLPQLKEALKRQARHNGRCRS